MICNGECPQTLLISEANLLMMPQVLVVFNYNRMKTFTVIDTYVMYIVSDYHQFASIPFIFFFVL